MGDGQGVDDEAAVVGHDAGAIDADRFGGGKLGRR
jgi:hypothetical protein